MDKIENGELRQIGTVEQGFIISDKAKNDVANGKGTKDDIGKTDLTLPDPWFVEGGARVLQHGMKKYARGNWQKDLDPKRIMAALKRHISDYEKGNLIDKETGESHMLHVFCNAQFLYYYERHGKPLETEHNKG